MSRTPRYGARAPGGEGAVGAAAPPPPAHVTGGTIRREGGRRGPRYRNGPAQAQACFQFPPRATIGIFHARRAAQPQPRVGSVGNQPGIAPAEGGREGAVSCWGRAESARARRVSPRSWRRKGAGGKHRLSQQLLPGVGHRFTRLLRAIPAGPAGSRGRVAPALARGRKSRGRRGARGRAALSSAASRRGARAPRPAGPRCAAPLPGLSGEGRGGPRLRGLRPPEAPPLPPSPAAAVRGGAGGSRRLPLAQGWGRGGAVAGRLWVVGRPEKRGRWRGNTAPARNPSARPAPVGNKKNSVFGLPLVGWHGPLRESNTCVGSGGGGRSPWWRPWAAGGGSEILSPPPSFWEQKGSGGRREGPWLKNSLTVNLCLSWVMSTKMLSALVFHFGVQVKLVPVT